MTDGPTALTAALADPPNLILLDINMPHMDGYEVCEALQANENLRAIPVIFLSALNETIDKVRAFEVGGRDYISKPFHIEEVIARIETQLHIRVLQQQTAELNSYLEKKNQRLERVHKFFHSTVGHMEEVIRKGTWEDELLTYIDQVKYEFDRLP